MAFSSFSIRRISDNTDVPLEEVDSIVRKELSLKDHEKDKPYGHFYFTETEEELGGFQKSISWAGLIHTVVYYSDIDYGKSTVYDIEAAMAWISIHAIYFPHSAIVFASKLMKVLKQSGYYVFVDFYRDDRGNPDEFVCSYDGHKIYRSKSGLFECDSQGKLLDFFPDSKNLMDETKVKEMYRLGGKSLVDYYRPCVHTLIIPEGVTSFEREFFRDGLVNDIIRFPSTLKQIGSDYEDCVFAGSFLPEVIIPRTVKMIGRFAFGASHIKRLVFEDDIQCIYLRQFKESVVDELVIPHAMWERNDGLVFALMEVRNIISGRPFGC